MIGTHKLSSIFNLRWYITIKEFYKSKSLILVDEVEVHTIAKGLLKYELGIMMMMMILMIIMMMLMTSDD